MYTKKVAADGKTYVHVYIGMNEQVDIQALKNKLGTEFPFFIIRNGEADFKRVIISTVQYISDYSDT